MGGWGGGVGQRSTKAGRRGGGTWTQRLTHLRLQCLLLLMHLLSNGSQIHAQRQRRCNGCVGSSQYNSSMTFPPYTLIGGLISEPPCVLPDAAATAACCCWQCCSLLLLLPLPGWHSASQKNLIGGFGILAQIPAVTMRLDGTRCRPPPPHDMSTAGAK